MLLGNVQYVHRLVFLWGSLHARGADVEADFVGDAINAVHRVLAADKGDPAAKQEAGEIYDRVRVRLIGSNHGSAAVMDLLEAASQEGDRNFSADLKQWITEIQGILASGVAPPLSFQGVDLVTIEKGLKELLRVLEDR